MSEATEQQSVIRVREALARLGARGEVRALDDSARTAKEAAAALGIEVGQIASSLIFLADGEPVDAAYVGLPSASVIPAIEAATCSIHRTACVLISVW